jgi:hypothetical protein
MPSTPLRSKLNAGVLARSVAAREGKRLNQVLEEARADHLKRKSAGTRGGVATRHGGSLKLSRHQVDRLLSEEPGILDG